MMYETTAQFLNIDAQGNERVVKQRFIVQEAENFGDAEDQTFMECDGNKELDVIAIKRSKIKEILNKRENDKENIYIAEVCDLFVDEEGNEKEMIYKMAFFSTNVDTAYSYIKDYLRQGYNLSLVGIKKTKFVDVITL